MDRNEHEQIVILLENIQRVIFGKEEKIELALTVLFADGHLLIEDVPGVGKTMLAETLARSVELDFKRIQFTPDLLPSDITGVSIYNKGTMEFEFRKGPIFCNLLLADEINRASPRTQSSMLESMQERQVSADGQTYDLPSVFFVIATQNPIELEGTYPLPEAQLDRFLLMMEMGYPDCEHEMEILDKHLAGHPLDSLMPVINMDGLLRIRKQVLDIYVDNAVKRYILNILDSTRKDKDIILGGSPRASLALMKASQALSLIRGQSFVEPQIVKYLAYYVLRHRIILDPQARFRGESTRTILERILNDIEVPIDYPDYKS